MDNQPESFHEQNSVVNELLAIRAEFKKLNQKIADYEKLKINNDPNWNNVSKNKPLLIILGLLTMTCLSSLFQTFMIYKSNKPTAYEYKVVSPSDISFEDSMNNDGELGWQIVSCRRASDRVTEDVNYECIMIRKKG